MINVSKEFANLVVNIKSDHGKYVRADKGCVDLTADEREFALSKIPTRIRIIETDHGDIAFQACDGRYISPQEIRKYLGLGLRDWDGFFTGAHPQVHSIMKNGNKMHIYVPKYRKYWCVERKWNDDWGICANAAAPEGFGNFTIEILTDTAELQISTAIDTVCSNNQQIEQNLISLNPKPFCQISDKKWVLIDSKTKMKPIFAYLKCVDKKTVPAGVEQTHTFSKEKGIVRSWEVSATIKEYISATFELVESETEISFGFHYSKQLSDMSYEGWQDKITGPAELSVYQPMIIFAVKQETPKATKLMHIAKDSNIVLNNGKVKTITANQAEWIVAKNRKQWKELELLTLNI